MIKLFTLENLSPFSSDAVYKICLSLEEYGMTDENIRAFASCDEMFDEAVYGLEAGDEIVIAAETADYNSIKRDLLSKLMLDGYSCPAIAEAIARAASGDEKAFDMEAHCTIPRDSVYHLSSDGLYSGFSSFVLNGRVTFVPLDFSRIDSILQSFAFNCLDSVSNNGEQLDEQTEQADENDPYNFTEPVSKMVYSLIQLDRRLSIATSEATMWIYNLYDKIDGLSEAVSFVEIVDPEELEEPEEMSGEPFEEPTDEAEAPEESELLDFDSEDDEEPEQTQEAEKAREPESASAKTIRHAREAMHNMETDFGAAISEVYSAEDEQGVTNYFAYIAVADEKSAKAKKINTTSPEDAELILPHCVTLLAEAVCQKADAINSSLSGLEYTEDDKAKKQGEKKLSKGMIAFAAVILLIAIICPIYIVHLVFKDDTNKQTQPNLPAIVTESGFTTAPTQPQQTQEATTAADPFGLNNTTPSAGVTADSNAALPNELAPAETGAVDVSAVSTTPSVSSTKGTFTFYVFGYGHGVGLSQQGANYLASQGWNYAQILANYYYGTTLVSGDSYPEKLTYNGQEYSTRDLLACALEGEMGSSFNAEALKAQVVAIYTFAKYYNFKNLDGNSFAYKSPASQAAYTAVDEVMKNGLYISYGGQTALTPFHAISAGITTSYYNVWGGTALPYLMGGRPSYGDYNAPNFKTTYTITSEEFKTLAESKNLGITCSGDPATWISIVTHDNAINQDVGYVSTINVGGKMMTGNDFRGKVMDGKIRSHCFTIVYTPDNG